VIEVTETDQTIAPGLISPYGGKLVNLVADDEEPLNPEIRLTTTDHSPEEDARQIISYLMDRGFLLQDDYSSDGDLMSSYLVRKAS